jgi:hypothetical protein
MELYILDRERLPAVLAPDTSGIPTLAEPQPTLLKAEYLADDYLEQGLPMARARLGDIRNGLFFLRPCPDGPPNRTGWYFTYHRALNISWFDGKTSRHSELAHLFRTTTSSDDSPWLKDARRGRFGYFLTGEAPETSLWRVIRLESDAFNHSVFTLSPIRVAANLPAPDFSSLGASSITEELAQQYDDLCRSFTQHAYRDVVTKARNIVEGIVANRLRILNQLSSGKLSDDLRQVEMLLNGPTRDSCGWTDMDYHLSHKIRLLHARTHVNQVARSGPLRPEFALTVLEDLAYLLVAWGLVRKS